MHGIVDLNEFREHVQKISPEPLEINFPNKQVQLVFNTFQINCVQSHAKFRKFNVW